MIRRTALGPLGLAALALAGLGLGAAPADRGSAGSGEPCAGCARIRADVAAPVPADIPEDEAARAFAAAARIWSDALGPGPAIRVRVTFRALRAKATAIPNPISHMPGVLPGDAWYPMALADELAGRNLAPSQYAMEIFFSDSVPWYFGTDGKVPAGEIDFETVALHEIAHGLGFASFLGGAGAWSFPGTGPAGGFPPLSFAVPDLGETPSVFDLFLEARDGTRLMEVAAGRERCLLLGRAVLDRELYFGGAHAARRCGGVRPRLDAANPGHLDESACPDRDPAALMLPKAVPGRAVHRPGRAVLGVLEDLGWRLRPADPPVLAAGPVIYY